MNYHFLNFKLEDTLKNYIESVAGVSAPVWGFGELVAFDEELAEPWIGVRCQISEPHADVQLDAGDGNRYFTAEIAFRTHAAHVFAKDGKTVLRTARDYHADFVSQVLDYFFIDSILTDLNKSALAVGNIHINEIDQPSISTEPVDRSFHTMATFRILCNPTQ